MNELTTALVDALTIGDHDTITDLANRSRRVIFAEHGWPEPSDLTPGDVRIVLRAFGALA